MESVSGDVSQRLRKFALCVERHKGKKLKDNSEQWDVRGAGATVRTSLLCFRTVSSSLCLFGIPAWLGLLARQLGFVMLC